MVDVRIAASYIAQKYNATNNRPIAPMALHKLCYFIQRESLVSRGVPIFEVTFRARKYGPVVAELLEDYTGEECSSPDTQISSSDREIIDWVFVNYGDRDEWSLSRLSRGEACWKAAREGIPENDYSDIPMSDAVMYYEDVNRIRQRRMMLQRIFGESKL